MEFRPVEGSMNMLELLNHIYKVLTWAYRAFSKNAKLESPNNTFNEYRVILLNWINRYKNICILYFIDYHFSTISNLNSNLNINIGDNFNVKISSHNTIDMNYFEIIS